MQRTCPNCNSPLFETDTVCWHCGQQRSAPIQQTEEISTVSTSDEDSEPQLEPISPALIFYYSFLMITIVLALLLLSRSLTQNPILTLNPDGREGDWISLTSPTKMFSIEIPATWNWHFQEGAHTSSSFIQLLENDNRISFAVKPLGDLVPDIDYLMVAQNDGNLLVVTSSERLYRLSTEQAAAALQTESFNNLIITEAQLLTSGVAEDRVLITLNHVNLSLKCKQHLVPAHSETYLIAVCTSAENYGSQQDIFKDILDSFTMRAP